MACAVQKLAPGTPENKNVQPSVDNANGSSGTPDTQGNKNVQPSVDNANGSSEGEAYACENGCGFQSKSFVECSVHGGFHC